MQVVCQASETSADVRCPLCGQGFILSWERTCRIERGKTLTKIQKALQQQHAVQAEASDSEQPVHPSNAFNIPEWSGNAEFSGAAMLGGLPSQLR
jgi:hypothetical protein